MSTNYPSDLRYTKDHEWTRLEADLATIGITSFAVQSLGDIVRLELPTEGEKFSKGQVLGTVESVKAVSDIYSPVTGVITKVNTPMVDTPESLDEDSCYDEGWLVQIRMTNPKDADDLLQPSAYASYVEEQSS